MSDKALTWAEANEIWNSIPTDTTLSVTKHSSNKPSSKLGDILEEANIIINGNRQGDYGSPEDSFTAIVGYWDWYLRDKLHTEDRNHTSLEEIEQSRNHITPKDVATMMTLLKIARENYKHKRDNLVDACGYLAILDDMYKE